MILSDEEIEALANVSRDPSGGVWPHNFAKAVQAAILAKLASAELPDIDSTNLWSHMFAWRQTEPVECEKHANAATALINSQLRQAYAQGAASQLSAEHVGYFDEEFGCIYFEDEVGKEEAHLPKLYTRKEASK